MRNQPNFASSRSHVKLCWVTNIPVNVRKRQVCCESNVLSADSAEALSVCAASCVNVGIPSGVSTRTFPRFPPHVAQCLVRVSPTLSSRPCVFLNGGVIVLRSAARSAAVTASCQTPEGGRRLSGATKTPPADLLRASHTFAFFFFLPKITFDTKEEARRDARGKLETFCA